jgi:isopenicillin-N epimerase
MHPLKSLFMLDPEVIFLNHGSFGACPVPVFETYQGWQQRLEKQPVQFLGREIRDLLRSARLVLGEYLNADPANLVYLPNATFAVNLVARSLELGAGEEVVISNHEYGACENAWLFNTRKCGARLVRTEIPLPLPAEDRIIDLIWQGISEHTRLLFISHITSPTAIRLPVESICRKAREDGIPVLIDGAHAPGQADLNLEDLGADFYTGNCHKWMLAPKGSAFLYARPERQSQLEPLVVSWGWGENSPFKSDTRFLQELEWWGTMDPAAYLSVPAAIEFQREHNWHLVREGCREMLGEVLAEIQSLTGLASIYGENREDFIQLGAAELPKDCQPENLQAWLLDSYQIEIPVISWEGRWLIRPSVQGYNRQEDLERLVFALKQYLSRR